MGLDVTITAKHNYNNDVSVEENFHNKMYFDGCWKADDIICDTTNSRFWTLIEELELSEEEKQCCTVYRVVDERMLDDFPRGIYFDDAEEELRTRIRQKIEQGLTIIIKLDW
jgi:aromatic ring-cleaving dioxygenase